MLYSLWLTALIAPIATIAAPTNAVESRQTGLVKPAPCVRNSKTTVSQTKSRSKAFARAFIYDQDISKAFEYIVSDYINHNPLAQNGSDSAWGILSPIWAAQDMTPLRTTFKNPQSWLEYNNTAFGVVVDRFRWEGGCIVEHWDQGEVFPSKP
ncbi:hypothetical protein C7974DRAFT_421510 [Boeremia exigua]|uniref:uncharacterized protein n=1 Tax=Boeremia exigua TaxID=749465 RepID=UPI001E8E81AD|nr:uncharacterized protein C7974DRAFT_421510 [Boeremia exigua]KAH6638852.1 hypothetical protein C7974DRAFT_421510 [Boeremia exigua]